MSAYRNLVVVFSAALLLASALTGLFAQSEDKSAPSGSSPSSSRYHSLCPQCDLLARVVMADAKDAIRLEAESDKAMALCETAKAQADCSKSRADQEMERLECAARDSAIHKYVAIYSILINDYNKLKACNKKCVLPIPVPAAQNPGDATKIPVEKLVPLGSGSPSPLIVPGAKPDINIKVPVKEAAPKKTLILIEPGARPIINTKVPIKVLV